MTLQVNGPISIGNLKNEFGGNASPKLSDYYNGGSFHRDGMSGVPSSGTISLSKLYNARQYSLVIKSNGQNIKFFNYGLEKLYLPNGSVITVPSTGTEYQINNVTGIIGISLNPNSTVRYVSVGGDGLTEVISFPYSPKINSVNFGYSVNLVKVPTILPPNITSLNSMFYACTSFNQDLRSWDVSNVTDMYQTFRNASSYNQPLDTWKVSKVETMVGMFMYANAFNQNLNQWCVSKITSMPSGFNAYTTLFTADKHPVWGTCPRGW